MWKSHNTAPQEHLKNAPCYFCPWCINLCTKTVFMAIYIELRAHASIRRKANCLRTYHSGVNCPRIYYSRVSCPWTSYSGVNCPLEKS